MHRFRFDRVVRLCGALLAAGLVHFAQAAELGDAAVVSYIGQPLVADIELIALADPAAPVSVRNAHADVYRGANIAVNPVLPSMVMSVLRRDGRQYLHLTSTRPVESEYVHLFLELHEGGKRNIRPVTLWLSADPAPKPPPPPPAPPPVVARPAPMVEEPLPPPKKPVREIILGQAPPACPQVSDEQAKRCAAAEYQNGLLSAQIVELEEKVKQLQMVIDGKAAAAPAAASAPPAAPVKPAIPPPPPKTVPKAGGGFPWLLVGAITAGLVLVGGVAAFFLFRQGKATAGEPAAAESLPWYRRLLRRNPAAAPTEPPGAAG